MAYAKVLNFSANLFKFCIHQGTVEQKSFTTEPRSFFLGILSVSVSQWFKKVCNLFLTITNLFKLARISGLRIYSA